jgi:hypothetical protein
MLHKHEAFYLNWHLVEFVYFIKIFKYDWKQKKILNKNKKSHLCSTTSLSRLEKYLIKIVVRSKLFLSN